MDSRVDFGGYDENIVKNVSQIYWIDSIDFDYWGVSLKSAYLGQFPITNYEKIAIIDTGSSLISIPQSTVKR